MSENTDKKSSIKLEFNNDSGTLSAIIQYIKSDRSYTSDDIKEEITKRGFDKLYIINDALDQIVLAQSNQKEEIETVIAERRDGEASIRVTDDQMQAYLTVTPSFGGEPVTIDLVNEILRQQNINFGINKNAIASNTDKPSDDEILIAEGEDEINGDDTRFISLIPEITSRSPQINSDGTVNLRELNQIVTVSQGDSLMRKTKPTPGKAGTDIFSKIIQPKSGQSIEFAPVTIGAEIDKDDKDLLISSRGGQPIQIEQGVNVEPVINMKKVDISTGNIHFDGSVNVDGDVSVGMLIQATEDVYVSGTVEAATIEAGGDIVIKQGVIGHGELRPENNEVSATAAVLQAGKTIQAKFVENAWLKSGESISIQDLVLHSELYSLNQIIVGKDNTSHGNIIGGLAQTTLLVEAQNYGSSGSIKTTIEVGGSPELRKTLSNTKEKLATKEADRKKVLLLLEHFNAKTGNADPALLKQTQLTASQLEIDVNQLFEECERYKLQIEQTENAKIINHQKTFNNVVIKIGNLHRNINSETGPGTFHIKEDEIFHE